jgi:hypothetical protein
VEQRNVGKNFARRYAYLFRRNQRDNDLGGFYERVQTYYIEEKRDATSSRTWPQWLLSFFIPSAKVIPKHEKYKNQLEKYIAYFRLLNKKHANLMPPSGNGVKT